MRAKARSPMEHERDALDIATMLLKGKTRWEILAWLNSNRKYRVSMAVVNNDIDMVGRRWRDQQWRQLDEQRRIEVEKIERIEREAWDAWESSKKATLTKTVRKGETGQEMKHQTRTTSGDGRFLDIVMRCIEKRCSLLGLDAPKMGELHIKHSVVAGIPDEHVDKLLREHYEHNGTIDIEAHPANGEAGGGAANGAE